MHLGQLKRIGDTTWQLPARKKMRVPAVIYGDRALLREMDDKVAEQVSNVACLPGIVGAAYAMPDAHWGYGFPIGGVAAFDPKQGGVVSAGGVGFDISCGVRTVLTGLRAEEIQAQQRELADALYAHIPAGVGSRGAISLRDREMSAMLRGGAVWAVEQGWGEAQDLMRIEEGGCVAGAMAKEVSPKARKRQKKQMGTLGSGNHYLEVQRVAEICDPEVAAAYGLVEDEVVIAIHCGSRGLGHQIGTEFLREMAVQAPKHDIELPDRELACAPIVSKLGQSYLGAMRGAINCALANRQILTHLTRQVFSDLFPDARLTLLYDVSHNTCKEEVHTVDGKPRRLFVHRKGATRAFGPGHESLPDALKAAGQPVFIGGSMGTESWILAGTERGMAQSFGSSCHGAGRQMSRTKARKQWKGRTVMRDLARRGILIRSPSLRGIAEEAPGAYKDVGEVVNAAERCGLSNKVARVEPLVCVKG